MCRDAVRSPFALSPRRADRADRVKIELLVTDGCEPCRLAERVWREVAAERGVELAVVELGEPYGRALTERLRLKTVPAVLVDGVLRGIGVQSRAEALALIERG